jgi:hypothetical protein
MQFEHGKPASHFFLDDLHGWHACDERLRFSGGTLRRGIDIEHKC